MSTRIARGMSNGDYHADPAISKSGLDIIHRSPAHYRHTVDHGRDETAAMRIGTAIHCAVLEPNDFWRRYMVAPACDRRTKEGKAQWTAFEAASSGKVTLSEAERDTVNGAACAVTAHGIASQLLKNGEAEVSCFAEMDGVDVRCRPDWLVSGHRNMIVDLKTTADASYYSFRRSVGAYRYHVQAAFYMDMMALLDVKVDWFLFVVVEKTPPYGVAVYDLDDETIAAGRREYMADLETYRRCMETGKWPGYPELIKSISLPNHLLNEDSNQCLK